MDSAFCAENGLCCWRPFLLFRFLLGAQKKMKTGLSTTKSRLNCSFRGSHYPKHFKNAAQLDKIKRSTTKANFQGLPFILKLDEKATQPYCH